MKFLQNDLEEFRIIDKELAWNYQPSLTTLFGTDPCTWHVGGKKKYIVATN